MIAVQPHDAQLLIKRARFERVLHLWRGEGLSTTAIAEQLGIDETDVCDLLEEAGDTCHAFERRAG